MEHREDTPDRVLTLQQVAQGLGSVSRPMWHVHGNKHLAHNADKL